MVSGGSISLVRCKSSGVSGCQFFGTSYKMSNVSKGVSQPQRHIIKYSNSEKSKSDAYPAISELL